MTSRCYHLHAFKGHTSVTNGQTDRQTGEPNWQ